LNKKGRSALINVRDYQSAAANQFRRIPAYFRSFPPESIALGRIRASGHEEVASRTDLMCGKRIFCFFRVFRLSETTSSIRPEDSQIDPLSLVLLVLLNRPIKHSGDEQSKKSCARRVLQNKTIFCHNSHQVSATLYVSGIR
jgi:hypothetical protein